MGKLCFQSSSIAWKSAILGERMDLQWRWSRMSRNLTLLTSLRNLFVKVSFKNLILTSKASECWFLGSLWITLRKMEFLLQLTSSKVCPKKSIKSWKKLPSCLQFFRFLLRLPLKPGKKAKLLKLYLNKRGFLQAAHWSSIKSLANALKRWSIFSASPISSKGTLHSNVMAFNIFYKRLEFPKNHRILFKWNKKSNLQLIWFQAFRRTTCFLKDWLPAQRINKHPVIIRSCQSLI